MDILLLLLGFIFMIVGILGSFLPIIPGPPLSWLGLLLLYLTEGIENDWWFLGITFVIAIAILVLDYAIPAIGTKKFGGSKGGVIGSVTGLIVAVAFPVIGIFGIVIWPFIGALTGEIIAGTKKDKAFKAAIGSFIGFLTGTFLKFALSISYLVLFVLKAAEYKSELFGPASEWVKSLF
ncbi:MAG: hypothetical protein CMC19_08050 [Flavobacteriaceae bacterium]|nr:hypothetical protein [Flavobacteriaceae bacterium]OUX39366.1 MAG: hypothetical protein CBE25_04080 [Flavobacteriaceae bacterium TMED265]